MAISRSWRPRTVGGPMRATVADIGELNHIFSDAFTERYRRDGMVGVRVPFLNPAIWRYAIDDAHDGAMIWRDERGDIIAFNMVHQSGREGWMGPLAVRTESQGTGMGKEIVTQGIEWLRARGTAVIGLETMPRTMDNIGFYSRLGFIPGRLTLTATLDSAYSDTAAVTLSRLSPRDRDDVLAACHSLVDGQLAGYDHSREITLTDELRLGETILLYDSNRLVGYALAHIAPLVEGRSQEELRVLKLAIDDEARFVPMARAVCDYARRAGARRVAFRIQGSYVAAYQRLIALGGYVRWTDLRMSLANFEEGRPAKGMVLSNWEI